jgi:hypothetical protein
VDTVQINNACKSQIFRSVITDVIASFRSCVKKFAWSVADVKLDRIKTVPMPLDGVVAVGNINNMVGGKIFFSFDHAMMNFIKTQGVSTDGIWDFSSDFFDCLTSISTNRIFQVSLHHVDTNQNTTDCVYHIRFMVKIFTPSGQTLCTTFVVSVDEIASMYFTD